MREDKEQMIETIFRGCCFKTGEIVELMKLMIEKGRYSKIDSVFEYFIGLVKKKENQIVYIATAVELSEAQKRSSLVQRLLLDDKI